MLDDVGHQFVDDQSQGNSHVSKHVHTFEIGFDAVCTTAGPTNLAAEVVQECIKPHDGCILARVQTLVHGRDSQDAGGCVTHRVGSPCPLNIGKLQLKNAGDDLQAVLNAVVDLFQQELLLRQLNLKCAFCLLKFTPLVQFAKLCKFREEADPHPPECLVGAANAGILDLATGSFGVLQKQPRRFLVDPQRRALRGRSERAGSTKTRVAQAIKLLITPSPWTRDLDVVLGGLEALPAIKEWPGPDTEVEDWLIAAARFSAAIDLNIC